jgi:mannose-6-phosphate isomerase-like protein (cupin superfamily)
MRRHCGPCPRVTADGDSGPKAPSIVTFVRIRQRVGLSMLGEHAQGRVAESPRHAAAAGHAAASAHIERQEAVMQNQVVEPTLSDVRAEALENDAFRKVVRTATHEQVVLMSIPPLSEIGAEVHAETDQLFVFVDGIGEAIVGSQSRRVTPGFVLLVPAGTRHNIVNRGTTALRLISVYAPPAHPVGTVHRTKEDAEAAER